MVAQDPRSKASVRRATLNMAEEDVAVTTVEDMTDFAKIAEMTKSQPIGMAQKREVMAAHRAEAQIIRSEISRCSMFWYRIQYAFSSAWRYCTSGLMTANVWVERIKNVEGGHGSHVGIYFKFMRWNMMLNVVIGLLWGLGVTLPQHLQTGKSARDLSLSEMNPSPIDAGATLGTTWWEPGNWMSVAEGLVRGSSVLNHSEYFMGSYMQETGAAGASYRLGRPELKPFDSESFQYYIPLAYLVLGIFTVLVSLVTLLTGVYNSFTSAVSGEELAQHKMCTLVFTEYDHAITVPHAMVVHCKDNAEKVKEILGTALAKDKYDLRMREHKWWIYFKRFIINILVLAILGGSCAAIYFATEQFINDPNFWLSIVPTITMVALDAGIPFVFEAMAELEEWETPLFVIIITVIRSTAEKVFVFAVFIVAIQNSLANHACWETAVGTETYAYFVVGVLIAEIFTSIFIDILLTALHKLNKRINGTHINEHGELMHPPGMFPIPAYFDTVKKILELSFAQALIWFGVFFSPLLPLVGVLRCVILFYVQVWSTNTFCSPKGTPFQAKVSFAGVIWITLGVHLLVGFVPCWYLIMSETPSGVMRVENSHFVETLYSPHEYDFDAKQFQQIQNWTVSEIAIEDYRREKLDLGKASEVTAEQTESLRQTVYPDQVPRYPATPEGAEVRGWCIVKPPPNATEDAARTSFFTLGASNHKALCLERTWIHSLNHTGPAAPESEAQRYTNGSGLHNVQLADGSGEILQCAELPNMISGGCAAVSDFGVKTADCEQCLTATDRELDQYVCYESKENNSAWLPHDCGVGLQLRTLCQRCPSGCGPFRNREFILDIFAENQALWDVTSTKTSAKVNRFFVSFFEFLNSPPFTVLLFIILIVVWAVKQAHLVQKKRMIEKLVRERAMDRIDKEWMLAEYGIQFEHKTDLNDNQDHVGKSALGHRKAAKEKAALGR